MISSFGRSRLRQDSFTDDDDDDEEGKKDPNVVVDPYHGLFNDDDDDHSGEVMNDDDGKQQRHGGIGGGYELDVVMDKVQVATNSNSSHHDIDEEEDDDDDSHNSEVELDLYAKSKKEEVGKPRVPKESYASMNTLTDDTNMNEKEFAKLEEELGLNEAMLESLNEKLKALDSDIAMER